MPTAPRPTCRELHCTNKAIKDSSRCIEHQRQTYKEDNLRFKPDPFYRSQSWLRTRKAFIAAKQENSYCCECMKAGVISKVEVVDHVIPRSQGGDSFAFSNLQPLCHMHHNIKRAHEKNHNKLLRQTEPAKIK